MASNCVPMPKCALSIGSSVKIYHYYLYQKETYAFLQLYPKTGDNTAIESVFLLCIFFYVALVEFEICTRENSDVNKLYLFYFKHILHHISFDWYNVQIPMFFYITSAHKANNNLIKGDCYS